MKIQQQLELLTPMFCRGAYQDQPELRVPAIRGMVRGWFREIGGTPDEEKEVFGGLNQFGTNLGGKSVASKLVFRITEQNVKPATQPPLALPHKIGGQGNPIAAFVPGGRFNLQVIDRLAALEPQLAQKASNAIHLWTLVGSLGLRSNRGGGSIWPVGENCPVTPAELRNRLNRLTLRWPVYLAPEECGSTAEELRAAATDTVKSPEWLFGSIRPRQASILKFKIVRLENKLRLLITSPEDKNIEEARRALRGKQCKPEGWTKL